MGVVETKVKREAEASIK